MLMKYKFIMACLVLAIGGCKDNSKKADNQPKPLFDPPKAAELRIKNKYVVNPFTGDSIKPNRVEAGKEVLPGAVPIPAIGEVIEPELTGIQSERKAGTPLVWPADSNVHFVNPNLKVVPLNSAAIQKVIAGAGKIITAKPAIRTAKHKPATEASAIRVKDFAKYDIQYFDGSTGMPSEDINCVYQHTDGNIWFGTARHGAIKYDGKSFTQYGESEGFQVDSLSQVSGNIQSIIGDSKGNIWFGGAPGITKYDGEKCMVMSIKQDKIFFNCLPLGEDKKGNIWFMAWKGLVKYDGKDFTAYSASDDLYCGQVEYASIDSADNIWIVGKNGLSCFDGKNIDTYPVEAGLPGGKVLGVSFDKAGNGWISTDAGVCRFNGKDFTHINEADGLPYNGLIYAFEDSKGIHWFISRNGAASYNGKSFTEMTKNEGLAGDGVTSIVEDNAGGIWVNSQHGASRISNTANTYYRNSGIAENVNAGFLQEDSAGNIWMPANEKGIIKYDGANFSHYTKKQGLYSDVVLNIKTAGKNVFTRSMESLSGFDGQNIRLYKPGKMQNTALPLLQDSKGNVWSRYGATFSFPPSGLLRYNGNNYTLFTDKTGLLRNTVSSLFEDSKGNIWISYFLGGVTKYDGQNFIHYTESEGLPSNSVMDATEDSRGNIWFANKGLTKFDGQKFTYYTVPQGIHKDFIFSFVKDSTGNIWAAAAGGVLYIHFNGDEVKFHYFPASSSHAGINKTTAMLIDKKYNLWKTDGSVLIKQSLRDFSIADRTPPVLLQSISINDRHLNFASLDDSAKKNIRFTETAKFYNYPLNPVVSFDNNFISFHYAAAELNNPSAIRYSYILQGFDTSWSVATLASRADYRNIPAGTYVFKVCAIGVSQVWSTPFEYAFTVLPPWYQTGWAYLLYAILLGGLLWLFAKIRVKRLLQKNQQLEKKVEERTAELKNTQEEMIRTEKSRALLNERMRLSGELHDEVGATLSGIAMYSHLMQSQLQSHNTAGIENSLRTMQQSSSQMVDKLNDIVWLINPEKDSLQQLVGRLEEYAIKMAAIKDIKANILTSDDISNASLPSEIRRSIYLFCKEAINNAVKYSNATELVFSVTENSGALHITVADNGCGFDATKSFNGNGLSNMRKRAEQMGAAISVESGTGNGTLIKLALKITP